MLLAAIALVVVVNILWAVLIVKGGAEVAERKSFDLESDDIAIEAWLRAPDTPLPRRLGNGSGFIDFTGRRIGHWDVESAPELQWARSLSFDDPTVTSARMRLLFAWPEDGQALDVPIYRLEKALDAHFGIKDKTTIPPALSNPLRGESESTESTELRNKAVAQKRVVQMLAKHRVMAMADVSGGMVGVRICGQHDDCPHDPPEGFVPLYEAEVLVSRFERDAELRRTLQAVTNIPSAQREIAQRRERVRRLTEPHTGPSNSGRFPIL